MPDVISMQRDVSFILQNGHATLTYVRPWLPNVAEVACIHCHPPAPLPKDLEEWVLGAGTHGVIVVSMGSSVTAIPNTVRQIFVQALSRISQKVIWKLDVKPNSTFVEHLPSNVKIVRWLPQQDLLGHPGVVALVSHGGLLSMFEAVYHAKPMVMLPVFCDHDANAAKAELDGYAVWLELQGLTADALVAAIKRVVHDPRFRTNVELRSRQFRDQPETPLQRAVFWTEHVLRHRGAAHLKGQWQNLGLLQWFYLDVVLMFLLFTTLALKLRTRYFMKIGQQKLKKQ
ncbi:UDP-glycosyltransferase-02b [Ephemera danica]|nr:UDP-glycosyltransferase-02b [Ephemera danica]